MLVFINKTDYLGVMRAEKGGVIAVVSFTACFAGPFAFAFGYGVGHNGVQRVEPTQKKTEVVVPYSDKTVRCVGEHTLRVTIQGQDIPIPVDHCQQSNIRP